MDVQLKAPEYRDVEGVDMDRWARSLEERSVKEDFVSLVDHILPEWIVAHTKEYAKELERLRKNWENICKIFHTVPREVLIVQSMYNPNRKDTQMFKFLCDFLTQKGFIVRTTEHLELCKKCSKAILTKELQDQLSRQTGEFAPYTGFCSECHGLI